MSVGAPIGADVRFEVDGSVAVDGAQPSAESHALRTMRDGFVTQESTVVLRSSEGTRPLPGPWVRVAPVMDDATRRLLTDLSAWDAATPEQRRLAADCDVKPPVFGRSESQGHAAGRFARSPTIP